MPVMNMPRATEQIAISKAKYEALLFDRAKLIALQEAGVDNWQGIDSVNWPKPPKEAA